MNTGSLFRVGLVSIGVLAAGPVGGLLALGGWELLRRRRVEPMGVDSIEAAARLLVLVGTGLPVVAAVAALGDEVVGLEGVARRARRLGSATALATATGELAPLLRRLGDAAASGSPPEPAIRSYIETERRRRHTEAVARARRLPVRLMIPMTLLVLPGFVVMVYGPVFVDMVTSLLGPLVG